MKKSKCVPLLLIGSMIALTGCEPEQNTELKQQSYNSLDDCKKDWAEEHCTSNTSSGTGVRGGGYYGPRYYWDRSVGKPIAVSSNGSETEITNSHLTSEYGGTGRSFSAGTVRSGGFGSMAHGFSGGG